MCLNADTGKQLWGIPDPDATLISNAIFAKPKSILAIDPQNGKPVWQWQPPADGHITGPPALRGQSVIVPTDAGMIALNSSDGKPTHADAGPSLAAVLRNPVARKMLHDLGAESFLSVPTSKPIIP
jgi:outer membrane protein assembly factor BamB